MSHLSIKSDSFPYPRAKQSASQSVCMCIFELSALSLFISDVYLIKSVGSTHNPQWNLKTKTTGSVCERYFEKEQPLSNV